MLSRPGECNCDCHKANGNTVSVHVLPCCHRCSNCGLNIHIHAYVEHRKQCKHILDIELGYFDHCREKLCESHLGKFALIKGTTVHDFYDTRIEAYVVGCDIWGLVPFLIKEVQLIDKILFMPDRVILDIFEKDGGNVGD